MSIWNSYNLLIKSVLSAICYDYYIEKKRIQTFIFQKVDLPKLTKL